MDENFSPNPPRRSQRTNKSKRPLHLRDFISEESDEPAVKQPRLRDSFFGLDTTVQSEAEIMALQQIESLIAELKQQQTEKFEGIQKFQENLMAEMKVERQAEILKLSELISNLTTEINNNTSAINNLQEHIGQGSPLNSLRAPEENLDTHTVQEQQELAGHQIENHCDGASTPATLLSNPQSVEMLTRQISQSITSALGTHRKLIPLPKFNGDADKWPQFIAQFDRTTDREGYSTEDNVTRLEQALEGKARELIASLLIHHVNVPMIIDRLRSRFGSPEQLVNSQLTAIRKFEPIQDDQLYKIVPFADQVLNLRSFLESAGCTDHLSSPSLLKELEEKLPYRERIAWAGYSLSLRPPTVKGFSDWILILADQIHRVRSKETDEKKKKKEGKSMMHVTTDRDDGRNCVVCDKSIHEVASCPQFKEMDCNARWTIVKANNMCFGCLKPGHQVFQCKDHKRCGIEMCKSKHNELLHDSSQSTANDPKTVLPETLRPVTLMNFEVKTVTIMFKVLPVKLSGPSGQVETFAFLDEGSSITLVNRSIAEKLGANGPKSKLTLRWFGNIESEEDITLTDLQISGAFAKAKQYQLRNVHIVNDLNLPRQSLNLEQLRLQYPSISKLPIQKYENAIPTILIGLDNAHLGVARNKLWNNNDGPMVCLTKLGYVIYGPIGCTEGPPAVADLFLTQAKKQDEELQALVKGYFSTEDFGVKVLPVVDSKEDVRAKYMLQDTTKKIGDRYESGLLWREQNPVLPNNFQMALKRLESCERKMNKNPAYRESYHKIMEDYFAKGYAKVLSPSEVMKPLGPMWYLPHFGVVNPHKPKLRLVFDAAASFHGVSLNSKLLPGPDMNQPLINVLSMFREKEYGVCADIREMYHQVKIREADKDAQRFLYREDPKEAVKICRMEVMTFGSTCSPVTAQFIKNENARLFIKEYEEAVKAIESNHYVDDFVCSFTSEEDAIRISEDVKRIHKAAGFELRGFISNSEKVSSALNRDRVREDKLSLEMDHTNMLSSDKILGLHWCTDLDVFLFKLKFHKVDPEIVYRERLPTKREFLAIIMSIFDPFGFLANFVVRMKILLQLIWKSGISWDDSIPDDYRQDWINWWNDLQHVQRFTVPRCLCTNLADAAVVEWHTMVDASELAFSACCYILLKFRHGENKVCFIAGKTKTAPLKYLSIPRLELQAAVLGVRLASTFSALQSYKIDKFCYWSDSKTVLFWIKDEKRRYRQFVANRIAEILDSTKPDDWYWVPSADNVADDATRNHNTSSFNTDSRWITGPSWLKNEDWPIQPKELVNSELDSVNIDAEVIIQKSNLVLLVIQPVIKFGNYSDIIKLKRHVAWIIRYIGFLKNKALATRSKQLSASEVKYAELVVCRMIQRESFNKEYEALLTNKPISKKSSLYRMSPFLDEDKVMRVYGRIENAPTIPIFTKRPIILPKVHIVTDLIIQHYHEACGHQFDEVVIAEIRRKFWINGVKTLVRNKKRSCVSCKVFYAKPSQPFMGQIPKERLTPYVRPFSFTGVDYFGPVSVSVGRRREKRWVALFTCLTVRAVHLEVSQDLSSDSFILCLKNLMNIRGVPDVMFSDNGSNIVGARNEIIRCGEFFENCGIKKTVADKGISWKFNNPGDAAAGGSWERLVQSIKRVLKRIMSDVAPKVETLRSFLIEAANIVNSRPLTDIPIDSINDDVLTPNSFLIGCPNWIQTPGPIDEKTWCLRKQWRILESLKNHFWSKWINDYLPTLIKRPKWHDRVTPLKVGDVVLICDSDIARKDWPKGIISQIIESKDGQVRSVIVAVKGKELRRPASKIALLDICNTSSDEELRGGGCHLGKVPSLTKCN